MQGLYPNPFGGYHTQSVYYDQAADQRNAYHESTSTNSHSYEPSAPAQTEIYGDEYDNNELPHLQNFNNGNDNIARPLRRDYTLGRLAQLARDFFPPAGVRPEKQSSVCGRILSALSRLPSLTFNSYSFFSPTTNVTVNNNNERKREEMSTGEKVAIVVLGLAAIIPGAGFYGKWNRQLNEARTSQTEMLRQPLDNFSQKITVIDKAIIKSSQYKKVCAIAAVVFGGVLIAAAAIGSAALGWVGFAGLVGVGIAGIIHVTSGESDITSRCRRQYSSMIGDLSHEDVLQIVRDASDVRENQNRADEIFDSLTEAH